MNLGWGTKLKEFSGSKEGEQNSASGAGRVRGGTSGKEGAVKVVMGSQRRAGREGRGGLAGGMGEVWELGGTESQGGGFRRAGGGGRVSAAFIIGERLRRREDL